MIAMNQGSFATKKSFKAEGLGRAAGDVMNNPSVFNPTIPLDGTFAVVGPHALSRKWYAEVTVQGGVIVKVT